MEAVFPASGNKFSIKGYSFRRVETHFFKCSFIQNTFCASGNHYSSLWWSHFLWKNILPTIGNHFLRTFGIYLPAGESSFSAQWKRIFLKNPSSRLMESEFLFNGNSFYLKLFFLLPESSLALKSVCTSRREGLSWSIVSIRRKKSLASLAGASEKQRKK